MRLRIMTRPDSFQRLRTANQALAFNDGDRRTIVLRALATVHAGQVRRAFSSRGASVESGPWPAWSPRYAAWRRKNAARFGTRMLRLTDTLFEKSTRVGHGNFIALFRPPFGYAFGFRDEPGFHHQEGNAPLPKRSLVDKTAEDLQGFVERFRELWNARVRQVVRNL